MERKKLISRIDRAHTTPEQQAAIDHHIEQGYRMSISALAEQSIALGGQPVAIPDFTNGMWIKRK